MTTLEKAKMILRITTDDFDEEINDLINAAIADMGIAGVSTTEQTDPLIIRAIMTFVKANFGMPDNYEKLNQSYQAQKEQLALSTGYTTWSNIDDE